LKGQNIRINAISPGVIETPALSTAAWPKSNARPITRETPGEFFDCLRNFDTCIERCVGLFIEKGAFGLPYFSPPGLRCLVSMAA